MNLLSTLLAPQALRLLLWTTLPTLAYTACSQPAHTDFELKRTKLTGITNGTPADAVLLILGKADEVRVLSKSYFEGESYRWAYGCERPGGFAKIGLVVFGTNGTAIWVSSPTRPRYFRSEAAQVALSDAFQKTSGGLHCEINSIDPQAEGALTASNSLRHTISYSLINEGRDWFIRPQETSSAKWNLVLEVYNADGQLYLRQDHKHFASAFSPDEREWPKLKIPPEGRITEEFPLWLADTDFGIPNPGKYSVRLLFPFERGKFYSSNLKEFQIR